MHPETGPETELSPDEVALRNWAGGYNGRNSDEAQALLAKAAAGAGAEIVDPDSDAHMPPHAD